MIVRQLEKKWKKVEDPDAPETTADAVKGLTRTETIEVSFTQSLLFYGVPSCILKLTFAFPQP